MQKRVGLIPFPNYGKALMSNDQPSIQVRFTNDCQQQVRDLAKRYRKIQSDIQPLIQQLEAGEISGEQVQGTG